MVGVYADESDDGTTYALAGWLTSPHGWNHLTPRWREMLATTAMPDGSPMPAFHAAEIVDRENIKGSRFKGWSFDDEKAVFTRAVDLIVEQAEKGRLERVGVSIHVPRAVDWTRDRDTAVWMLLFGRLMSTIILAYTQQRSFTFVFDNKPNVRKHVNYFFDVVHERMNKETPGYFADNPYGFACDEREPPLQVADLLAYEWRKRSSDRILAPNKRPRRSYERLKAATKGHMLYYGPESAKEIISRIQSGESVIPTMLACPADED